MPPDVTLIATMAAGLAFAFVGGFAAMAAAPAGDPGERPGLQTLGAAGAKLGEALGAGVSC